MCWGPEKMLIRYSKGSQHPAEWTPGPPVEHQENEKDTTLTALRVGDQNIAVSVRSPAPPHTQTLSNPFRTLAIKWEVNILLKKSSCVFIIVSLWCCRWRYNTVCAVLAPPFTPVVHLSWPSRLRRWQWCLWVVGFMRFYEVLSDCPCPW